MKESVSPILLKVSHVIYSFVRRILGSSTTFLFHGKSCVQTDTSITLGQGESLSIRPISMPFFFAYFAALGLGGCVIPQYGCTL